MREKRHQRRQRRLLWLGLSTVLVPLIVLLYVQYRWLIDLEQTSKVARRATLENYLATVVKDVRYSYATSAERALNVPAAILDPQYLYKIEKFLKKKGVHEGVRWFFVFNFKSGTHGEALFYDPKTYRTTELAWPDPEYAAVLMAVSPWKYLRKKSDGEGPYQLSTEERDPDHRMILNPILDDGELVGLAGMILDDAHFKDVVLPRAVCEALPEFAGDEGWLITLRDADGEILYASGDTADAKPRQEIRQRFDFVFTDWTLGLQAVDDAEQLAKANFAFNITLSVVLAVALLGGILLVVRAAAREMKLSEMKNDFVSNVSHELRTPLSSIRVFGEFLRLGRVRSEAKIRQYGEYIETESRRLTQLINNILDFSRIESGGKIYRFEETDVAALLREVTETFDVRLRHDGFELDLRLPEIAPPEIPIDADAIAQALANLIDNAVKYSNGGKRIEVGLRQERDEVVIAVRDFGIGIARAERKKIFERFHRVGTDLVHDVKGSGLGLSIVHHIVRAHGGRVEVESELGRGSTFSIHLPLVTEVEGVSLFPLEPRAEGRA